jgi:hypothetical protein
MLDFVIYTLYWSMVFSITAWWCHMMWPWGLLMIPFMTAYIYLARKRYDSRWWKEVE